MTILTEGGIRPGRYEFVPENVQGETPTDPDFQAISDRVTSFEPELGPEMVEKAGIGEYIHDLEEGTEENSATLEYDLQQWLLDSNGDPQDLAAYGILRSANALVSSLTVVERMQSGDIGDGTHIQPESTVEYDYRGTEGAVQKATRVYTVMKGVDVEAPTLSPEIEDATVGVEVDLANEEGRSYQIDQPPDGAQPLSATWGGPDGTDASDDGLTLIIENSDASVREEVLLEPDVDGNRIAPIATAFPDIDAVEVVDSNGDVADHMTDILVEFDGGAAAGELATVLYGRNYYGNTAGDGGIPTLGTGGTRAGELGTEFYKAANISVERPPGTPFEAAGSVQSLELSFENDIERTAQQRTRSMRQHQSMMTPTLSVTADGETISHRQLVARMSGEEEDTVLGFDRAGNETITLPRTKVTESPRSREAESVGTDQEFELRAQDAPEISAEAA